MYIKVLGCSTAFPGLETFNQSFAVFFDNGDIGLVDCGEDTPKALLYHGIDVKKIKWIYISHRHSDHCYGIVRVGLNRYDWQKMPKHFSEGNYAPILYGSKRVLDDVWQSTKNQFLTMGQFSATMETYFNVQYVKESFSWDGWDFKLINQVHVISDDEIVPSYGLMVSKPGMESIYLTTDTQFKSPGQEEYLYDRADIIVQDADLNGINTLFEDGDKVFKTEAGNYEKWPEDDLVEVAMALVQQPEGPITWNRIFYTTPVHASFGQLAGYGNYKQTGKAEETWKKFRGKMYLSHFQDFKYKGVDSFGNKVEWDTEAKKAGFAGFLSNGFIIEPKAKDIKHV